MEKLVRISCNTCANYITWSIEKLVLGYLKRKVMRFMIVPKSMINGEDIADVRRSSKIVSLSMLICHLNEYIVFHYI